MANKNIQMKNKVASVWNNLYPLTLSSNVYDVNGKNVDTLLSAIKSGIAINVKDYGAKGDNSTDDTTAIQNAINAIVSAGGGELVFPTGIYRFTTLNVTGANNLTIKGMGVGNTILRQTSATLDAFTCSATTSWQVFEDFTLDTAVTKTGGSFFNYTGSATRCKWKHLKLTGWLNAIKLDYYEHSWIEECELTTTISGGAGIIAGVIGAGHAGANLYISKCILRGNSVANYGVKILDTDAVFMIDTDIGAFVQNNVLISATTISDNHYFTQNWFDTVLTDACVKLEGAGVKRQISFCNCWFGSAGQLTNGSATANALRITGAGAYGNLQFTGCRFYNSKGTGILIDSASCDALFTGCVIHDCGNANTASANYGIYVGTNDGQVSLRWVGGKIASTGANIYTPSTASGYCFENVDCSGSINNNGRAKSFLGSTSGDSRNVASANSIVIPPTKNMINISGTTVIVQMNKTYAGHIVTLIFAGALTVSFANNIHIRSDFTTQAGSTLTLMYDETLEAWKEINRNF